MPAPIALVVDDDPDTRELYAHYLRFVGIHAESAGSCDEALDKAKATLPAVIVLDLMMPDVTGLECIEPFRALPGGNSIPIVACTADTRPDTQAAVAKAGFDDLLTKPCPPDLLAARVITLLTTGRPRRSR
jgi:CheY-like chemotaxis protein